jgi:hypothetical protein
MFAVVAIATPAVVSTDRLSKDVIVDGVVKRVPCIECPCDGFFGKCTCIPNGCCCN